MTYESTVVARVMGAQVVNRRTVYTLTPVIKDGDLISVAVTAGKVKGSLDVAQDGSFHTEDQTLTNLCQLGQITPAAMKLMVAGKDSDTECAVEVSGKLHQARSVHVLVGKVAADGTVRVRNGTVRVRTRTETPDKRIRFVTMTELGADGMPASAESAGDVVRGLVTARVRASLSRK